MDSSFTRTELNFRSQSTTCASWLYRPTGTTNPPVVVMAHGFGAERSFRLPAFAERFVQAGIAVFLFDYRGFGDSHGVPRQLIDPFRQLADWKAAIAHVRSLPRLDAQRPALWGTSFSGGHVMRCAADDPDIAAIVVQAPFLDPFSTIRRKGVRDGLRLSLAALRDLFRAATLRRPHVIPIVAAPGRLGWMNPPDALPGFLRMLPAETEWRNETPARSLLPMFFYRPIAAAPRVKCPALFVLADVDSVVSSHAAEKAAASMPAATVVRLKTGHFSIYVDDGFEQAVRLESEFLVSHLVAGGQRTVESGQQTVDSGQWAVDSGRTDGRTNSRAAFLSH